MNVALVRPPGVLGEVAANLTQHPMNLAEIGAFLRQFDFEVQIWDFEVEGFSREAVRTKVEDFRPAVVGITAMTPVVPNAQLIAACIKECAPETVVVIGGPHASALPGETLQQFPSFDCAAFGEGEVTMRELCDAVRQGKRAHELPGVAWRNDDTALIGPPRPLIEDLDTIPYPARDLLQLSLYTGVTPTPGLSGVHPTEISISRGCPHRCTFCASAVVWGRRVRSRSAAHVAGEIKECVDRWHFDHFTFNDDTFAFRPDRIKPVMDTLGELGATWDCHTSVHSVDEGILRKMAESGCRKIAYGVESGSPRVLSLIGKKVDLEWAKRVFAWTHDAGILSQAFFMIGSHPSETVEEVKCTARMIRQLDPDLLQVAIAVPLPGTELFKLMSDGHLLDGTDWSTFQFFDAVPSWSTDHLTGTDMVQWQKKLLRRFYLRPRYVWRRLVRLRGRMDAKYWLGSGTDFLRYILRR
jgi:anaerobic magnesium-protoporphyrin IX monomethyl ester cyclase